MVDGRIKDVDQNAVLHNNIDIDLYQAMKTLNLAIAANGALYTRDEIGVIPSIIAEYYDERKQVKKEMLSVESELEEIKYEIDRRNSKKKEIGDIEKKRYNI